MEFIQMFKNKFCFVQCYIQFIQIGNKEKKIVSYPSYYKNVTLENWKTYYIENKNKKHNVIILPKYLEKNEDINTFYNNNNNKNNNLLSNSFAIKTGKISNITVLDFDTEYAYNTFLQNVPNFDTYFTVKTKKGYHVYCLYNSNLKTCNNILKGYIDVIDIRNDETPIICPPSSYIDLDGNIFTYKFLGGEIKEVPQFLFDCLSKINKDT
jgi:hypothetical protein